ncbi:unnamed protein product (macronuclear) [Paramecium tetraurelia]|uniref:Protein kinase domain-containing protein n=1 Tax=Paramecium tetraurelia TaxID=5888 RepID=A0BD99_PARTE|nr:uncharacterized protein GSPATT00004610001 [Paramecium tetraurelia]CAK56516.1 unnamed protein product [Paramecium tetraurelia]|eukprot:XP_001423914.1 hypothetical protein (macronuclear) [Paramecium tetraurelia strain d4-2]
MKRLFHKLNLETEKKITYEQTHRKCFFQKDFVRMQWNRSKIPKITTELNVVQIVVMESKQHQKKIQTIMVHENIIVKQKKDGSLCWIDYENSILEMIHNAQYGDGIRLIKCFDQFEMFGDLDRLMCVLKKFTIQLENFRIIIKFLRRLVPMIKQRIRSRKDKNDFQCKIYNKKLINATIEVTLEKELRILRRINDENVQKYIETFENQDQIIIVQELIIGGNLDQYLLKWPLLSEEKASKLFFKLFKSLAYLHSKGVMHRDLKPENIGLRLNGNLDNPCITSFGLADTVRITHDSDSDEDVPKYLFQRCGTPGFVAPEILKNQEYNCKVDVYSVGIILYYSLTGKKPFDSQNYREIIEKNEEGIVDLSPLKLTKEGIHFIESILQPDPKERITSQMALNHIWFRNEKISKLMELKVNTKMKNIQFKSPQYRQSIQNHKNLPPLLAIKQGLDQPYGSPRLSQLTSAQRSSLYTNSTRRISNLNVSFSPKDINSIPQSQHHSLYTKLNQPSPSLLTNSQRPSQSLSFQYPFMKQKVKHKVIDEN